MKIEDPIKPIYNS